MARIWFTHRFGFHPGSALWLESEVGESEPPYDRLNLGLKVGDHRDRVLANRELVRNAIGLTDIRYMDQIHSSRMVEIDSSLLTPEMKDDVEDQARQDIEKCDGIFLLRNDPSKDEGSVAMPGIAVQVADCVPLIIVGESLIAAVHIGRDGLMAGMTESALDAISVHSAMSAVRGVIGPSICGDCYPNAPEVFDVVTSRYPETRWSVEERKLDVAAGVISVLESRGVAWTWFGGGRECVSCDDQYFSYRRATRSGNSNTGRQAMIVAW